MALAATPDPVTPAVLPVAACQASGTNEFRISVTFYNAGMRLPLDYTAFLHFDRSQKGEGLLSLPAPGPRPLVAVTQASTWAPDEVTTVTFAAVTMPPNLPPVVYVKAGLYDAAGEGGRLALAGEDASHRVLVGRLQRGGEVWAFHRSPPAAAGDGPAERVGVRPRAFVSATREGPLLRFGEADLAALRVAAVAGGAATLTRTRRQLCRSEASLQVTYSGTGNASGFVLQPAEPMPVPDNADVAFLWVFGNTVGWNEVQTGEEPRLGHDLRFLDSTGVDRVLTFPVPISYPSWYLARVRLPGDWPRPLRWTGAGFSGCTNRIPRWLLLDSLTFSHESMAETLTPAVALADVPFPTSVDAILPPQRVGQGANRVEAVGDLYRLVYAGNDGELAYSYRPATGTLADIEAVWTPAGSGGRVERLILAAESGPMAQVGGKRWGPLAAPGSRTCTEPSSDGTTVTTRWQWVTPEGTVHYTLALSVHGKSLVADVTSPDPVFAGFAAGTLRSSQPPQAICVPYWSYGIDPTGRDGILMCVGEVFVSGFPDLFRSRATTLEFGPRISHSATALLDTPRHYCPGVVYTPGTDGRRPPLCERFVYTVSPDVHEVLPAIPHAGSPNRDRLAGCLHATVDPYAGRLDESLSEWRRLADYGVRDVFIRHFPNLWADDDQGPQEWTLTERAAPVAGDDAVRRYLDALTDLGFLPAMYTNYTDLQPFAAEFGWERVARLPNGDISPYCWYGSYPLKPLRAVELEAFYAPRIARRFGMRASFCDVHTAVAPWHKLDFDSRLPGAGEFGTTYRCYAKLLLNERSTYGAVYSEGSRHWLYAGLHDGSDAELRSPAPHREPFLVDFDLLRLHPLEMDAGMSWFSRYVRDEAAVRELGGIEAALDRYTAATLAFGHQGTFTFHALRGYRTDLRTWYLVSPLQRLYAMTPVTEIAYRDPASGRMLDSSTALRTGAYRQSQVYIRYASGLDLWVNGSLTEPWPVPHGGGELVLPPSGFLGMGPQGLLAYSAQSGGGRVDYSAAGDVRFADARGTHRIIGDVETDGATIVRRRAEGILDVWPLGNLTCLRVNPAALGVATPTVAIRCSEDGTEIGRETIREAVGWVDIPLDSMAFRIEMRRGE